MKDLTTLKALFETKKVNGRGTYCPRVGVYQLIEIYDGSCYEKHALMATAYWKQAVNEEYSSDLKVVLQLESIKGVDSETKKSWVMRELNVTEANYERNAKMFNVTWELLPTTKISLEELNTKLADGNNLLSLDLDDDQIDYSNDDVENY